MTLLTAYNQDVQRFFQGGYCNKIRKETILSTIEEKVFEMGKSFGQLFPNKRKQVLDEIIYLLSGTGICKIGADKLAEKVNCSTRTVKSAVASIKETDQLVVARLADDKAGKYIFVYKEHPNFHQILKEVFFLDSLPESDAIAPPFAPLVAPLQNAEPVEAVSVKGQKTSSNHINSFNSLQERDSIQQAIENDVQDSNQNQEKTREKLQAYRANKYQLMLFDEIMAFPFPHSIKTVAGTIALRVGMDCDERKVLRAMQLLNKMAINMINGVEIRNIVAVFSEGMVNQRYLVVSKPAVQPPKTPKVPFYNWLEDRG
ncbi:cytosolic protein [Planococcus sp. ISL-110]|uniref:cytosolic protein n=1 Tax=Planococcus sp. ISL-110 TaxID=2819167 RepID=UPI001BED1A30|nr:cytosolic protein [Planococcus sp. ISL-110]MBT2572077.1 cytosolic protein [Planococcus sp. ISL-110]